MKPLRSKGLWFVGICFILEAWVDTWGEAAACGLAIVPGLYSSTRGVVAGLTSIIINSATSVAEYAASCTCRVPSAAHSPSYLARSALTSRDGMLVL